MKKSKYISFILMFVLVTALLSGCVPPQQQNNNSSNSNKPTATESQLRIPTVAPISTGKPDTETISVSGSFNLSDIPAYSGKPWVEVNGNKPYFTEDEIIDQYYEAYSGLDSLGRCGVAMACLSKETMPQEGEKRGDISRIKPSGWHTVKYPELIKDLYLYNRCHLIGWQLSAENDNECNLTTGTRYLNVDGMLPFEDKVDDYIDSTNHHVMYRVTPIFVGEELVCRGILMEAQSVEDNGCVFCVYCYDVQPGVEIDYLTGDSWREGEKQEELSIDEPEEKKNYVLNTKTMKVHKPDCDSVKEMNENNKQSYTGTLKELEAQGYSACGKCKPN